MDMWNDEITLMLFLCFYRFLLPHEKNTSASDRARTERMEEGGDRISGQGPLPAALPRCRRIRAHTAERGNERLLDCMPACDCRPEGLLGVGRCCWLTRGSGMQN